MKKLIFGVLISLISGAAFQSLAHTGGMHPSNLDHITVCGELKTINFRSTTDIGVLPQFQYALPWQILSNGMASFGEAPGIISDFYNQLRLLADKGLLVNVSARDTGGNQLAVYAFSVVESCEGLYPYDLE